MAPDTADRGRYQPMLPVAYDGTHTGTIPIDAFICYSVTEVHRSGNAGVKNSQGSRVDGIVHKRWKCLGRLNESGLL